MNSEIIIIAAAGKVSHYGLPGVVDTRRKMQPCLKNGHRILICTVLYYFGHNCGRLNVGYKRMDVPGEHPFQTASHFHRSSSKFRVQQWRFTPKL